MTTNTEWPEYSPIDSQVGARLLEFMALEWFAHETFDPGIEHRGVLLSHPYKSAPTTLEQTHLSLLASASAIHVLLLEDTGITLTHFGFEFEAVQRRQPDDWSVEAIIHFTARKS